MLAEVVEITSGLATGLAIVVTGTAFTIVEVPRRWRNRRRKNPPPMRTRIAMTATTETPANAEVVPCAPVRACAVSPAMPVVRVPLTFVYSVPGWAGGNGLGGGEGGGG